MSDRELVAAFIAWLDLPEIKALEEKLRDERRRQMDGKSMGYR